ncbi:MAG: YbaN family protein [Allosphingosinicella sp.]
MIRIGYLTAGMAALLLGAVGVVVPGLPTVPFLLLAAFCFARADPRLERRLLEHRHFGPHILAWRNRRAIGPRAKSAAIATLAASSVLALVLIHFPWSLLPVLACIAAGSWIATRPA